MNTTTLDPVADTSPAEAVQPAQSQRFIPLAKLVPSPLNVRTSGGENIDELAMLIDSHGLLQQLIVVPHVSKKKPTDKFEVVAGGRRLRALRKLAELGKIGQDEEVACMLITREEATSTSTAENSGREPMTMADTVCAFAQMVKDGATVEEVAVCFGITPLTVRRRLKLANVSPTLFELFRQEQMNLDQLMALAISDDHEAQERVWEGMHSYERHATNLRRQLLGREIEASRDPVTKFVGIEAYEAAGGVVTRDLFAEGDEQGYIADAELLYRLAMEKLESHAVKLRAEGWKFVECRSSFDYSERHAFAEAPMGMREPTAKEKEKLEVLAKEQQEAEAALEALYEKEDDADQDEADALEKRADKAMRETDKLHTKMRQYVPDVLAIAGAVVTVDHSGEVCIYRGLVKPEDRKEAKRLGKASPANGTGDTEGDEPAQGGAAAVSESLHRKLTAHRTRALQVLVADNAHVALACVVHTLAQQLVIEHSYCTDSALIIRANGCESALGQFADDMEGSTADTELQSRLANWRDRIPGDSSKLLPWLIGQDEGTLLDLLALCSALSINVVTASMQVHPGDAIAQAVGLDMADWWSPTATSYLQQVPKARIVEAVTEALSAEAAAGLAKLKKGEAVAKAESLLSGTRWLPTALRVR